MIYLDYNATTPCDPEVVEAMLPYFSEKFGNASSVQHAYGLQGKEAVRTARGQVAAAINAEAGELYFTSGATESCNLAIKGVFERYATKGRHIITCATEHPAVLNCCKSLEKNGAELTVLPVDEDGLIRPEDLEGAIRPDTILLALMYANNETGVIQPIRRISEITRKHQVLFFCDATQALGKIPVDVQADHIDLLAISGHKIYGPKGVGALFVRRRQPRVALHALIEGGGQEKGLRSGTLNVPGIVGLGKACELLSEKSVTEGKDLMKMRDTLEQAIKVWPRSKVNGGKAPRLPNTLNMALPGLNAAGLSAKMQHQLAYSLGSACATGDSGPSHVLRAMQLSPEEMKGSLRLSLGRFTTDTEVQQAAALLKEALSPN